MMKTDKMIDSEQPAAMPDTTCANARILLDVLSAQGVENIVLSPGSRNAPLLIGVSARPQFRKSIIDDERTAGFFALGLAVATGKPVALVCTSGTALYNYAPAVAEAYYQKIPLIVITADRPCQWIDQDDSQTLRQPYALENIVKKSFDIPFDAGTQTECANKTYHSEHEWLVNRTANEAFLTATTGIRGPVHINIQLAAPLGKTCEKVESHPRVVEVIGNNTVIAPETAHMLAERLIGKRVMVVAGFMPPDNRLNRALSAFSRQPNVTVMCETISNLHLDGHVYMVDSLLSRMDAETKRELAPDVVISIGGSLVSRMLKEYLRASDRTEHWTLAETDVSVDCFQRLTTHVDVEPRRFFNAVSQSLNRLQRKGVKPQYAGYREEWNQLRDNILKENEEYIESCGWSELKALHRLFRKMPREYNLFLSNGTPVRYAQLLIDRLPHGCYCNRGVSGIDGTNATALGMSAAYNGTTLLVTGDISFSYCPEILHLIEKGGDLRIVVINNRGGGIFRFIPTTRELETREEYFCCDPGLPVKRIAEAYGWNYVAAADEKELKEATAHLFSTPRTLLEIQVNPEASAQTLIRFLKP